MSGISGNYLFQMLSCIERCNLTSGKSWKMTCFIGRVISKIYRYTGHRPSDMTCCMRQITSHVSRSIGQRSSEMTWFINQMTSTMSHSTDQRLSEMTYFIDQITLLIYNFIGHESSESDWQNHLRKI